MIPVFKPLIEKEEFKAVQEALDLGWLGMGSYVSDFENEIQKLIGIKDKHPVAVNTGTSALHLALLIAGVGAGDEVIVPAFNASSDFQVIEWVGAEVVFCDCDEYTLSIDLQKASNLITTRTKAIIVMDYDCIISDHDKVKEFADKHGLRVIHDAAHSFGSFYKNKPIGSFSDICVFSHDPVKTVTCLDGGTIVVNTTEEKYKLHELRLLGMQQPASIMYQNKRAWTFDISATGYRYHMINMHAAVGLAQLKKIEIIRNTRQQSCRLYNSLLKDIAGIIIPKSEFIDVNPFLYYIRVLENQREKLRNFLFEHGVDTGIHWIPGHRFSKWKDARQGDLSITNKIADQILSLPLHSKMSDLEVIYICEQIRSFFADN